MRAQGLQAAGFILVVRAAWVVPVLGFCTLAGCAGKTDRVPPVQNARQALEATLEAWKDGQPAGKVETAGTEVHAVDGRWIKGQRLEHFEILGEETKPDGQRWFSVQLKLSDQPEASVQHYIVTGRSPMWVYREEDYQRSQNWAVPE